VNSKELREHKLNQQKPSQKLAASPQTTAFPPEPLIHRSKIQTNGETSISPIETRVNGEKLHLTEQEPKKLQTNGGNANLPNKTPMNGGKWLHQHTTTQKLQELTLWMGTGFTRSHGGRLMILPADQDARALPRQIWIDFAPC